MLSRLNHIWFFAIPGTVARQAPLSKGFFSQKHWSGLPFLPPGDLPDLGMEPAFLVASALAVGSLPLAPPGDGCCQMRIYMWCNAGNMGSNLGSGRAPGEGNGNPLQYSCLGNTMDRTAWRATVHRVARVRHDLATKPPRPHWDRKQSVGLQRWEKSEEMTVWCV